MWPRVVELMLGVWLVLSPFVFDTALGDGVSVGSFACGAIVVIASCLSYWPPTRHARAATALAGLGLVGGAYVSATYPAAPALQNALLAGLLLIMFAIVPNEAGEPPVSWRPFVARRGCGGKRFGRREDVL